MSNGPCGLDARLGQLGRPLPRSLALTGGMGAGKSTVARLLGELLDAPVIDVDGVCRDLLQPGKAGWLALRENWGDRFLVASGEVDRPRLRVALFADDFLRRSLDALLHPLARAEVRARAEAFSHGGRSSWLVIEVPLLFEAGWQDDFERTVVVWAEPEICAGRLVGRDGVSLQQARQAISRQWPLCRKVLLADHVVDNGGCRLYTLSQLFGLRRVLLEAAEKEKNLDTVFPCQ